MTPGLAPREALSLHECVRQVAHQSTPEPASGAGVSGKAQTCSARTCSDDRDWELLVDSTESADVYFRPGYARAYEMASDCRITAVVVDAEESRFLVPLSLRTIGQLSFAQGVSGTDAVTPYGYGGLLQLAGPKKSSAATIASFFAALRAWCVEAGVVSALIRLHPLLDQEEWLEAGVEGVGRLPFLPTVALDMLDWDRESGMITTLRKGRRSDLVAARKLLTISWASDDPVKMREYLNVFRGLYEGRMDELQAEALYHFPPAYYSNLVSGLGKQLDVAILWLGAQAVGGGLFMAGKQFAHYHLSATNNTGRQLKANTMLINEAVGWARSRGCRWLHLGGGKHGEDALFSFKKSFGGQLFRTCFVSFIPDPVRYRELTEMRQGAENMAPPRIDYFPEYRA